MCEKNNNSSFISGAVIGAAAGALLGLLLAPEKGEETRKKLRVAANKYASEGKATMEKAEVSIGNVVREAGTAIAPIIEKVQEASKPLKEELMEKIQQLAGEVEEKVETEKRMIRKHMFKGLK